MLRQLPFLRVWKAHQLVRDSEAFLSGRYLERAPGGRDHVAPWKWLNVLAHGTRQDIEALSRGRSPVLRGDYDGGHGQAEGMTEELRAAQYVAYELLTALRNGPLHLREIQCGYMVPLELRFLDSSCVWATRRAVAEARKALSKVSSGAAQG